MRYTKGKRCIDKLPQEGALRQLTWRSVARTTAATYANALSTIRAYFGDTPLQEASAKQLCEFFVDTARQRSASTLRNFYSALLKEATAEGWPRLLRVLRSPRLRETYKAACHGSLTVGKPRGAITIDKLQQLVWATPRGPYRSGFILAYAAMLRHQELMDLRVNNLVVDGENVRVTVIGGKAQKARQGHPATASVTVAEGFAIHLPKIIEGRRRTELVFPDWQQAVALAHVARAARIHGWDPALQWTVHSLRHGAATDLRLAGRSELEICAKGRWSSPEIMRSYVHIGGVAASADYGEKRKRARE